MPYKGKRHSNKSCVTHWACTQDTLVALSGGEQVMFGEGLSLLINTSIIPAGSDRSPQTCRDPGSICGWHITQAGCHKHEGRGLCHSSLNKPTWAFRAALLRLRHRVFTGQNRTLDGVTFHMAWLRDHRHKVHRRQSAVLKAHNTTYHLWKRFKNRSYTVLRLKLTQLHLITTVCLTWSERVPLRGTRTIVWESLIHFNVLWLSALIPIILFFPLLPIQDSGCRCQSQHWLN